MSQEDKILNELVYEIQKGLIKWKGMSVNLCLADIKGKSMKEININVIYDKSTRILFNEYPSVLMNMIRDTISTTSDKEYIFNPNKNPGKKMVYLEGKGV